MHVINWWLEIGPTTATGMGEGPIGWQEIAAWQQLTGTQIEPWEARCIRRMSQAFISERHEAKKPNCPEPYRTATQREVQDKVSAQFAQMAKAFKGMAKAGK